MGIGAGETIEEAVCRGLQRYLDEELKEKKGRSTGHDFRFAARINRRSALQTVFKCTDYLKWSTDHRFKRGYSGLPCHTGKVEWSMVH